MEDDTAGGVFCLQIEKFLVSDYAITNFKLGYVLDTRISILSRHALFGVCHRRNAGFIISGISRDWPKIEFDHNKNCKKEEKCNS